MRRNARGQRRIGAARCAAAPRAILLGLGDARVEIGEPIADRLLGGAEPRREIRQRASDRRRGLRPCRRGRAPAVPAPPAAPPARRPDRRAARTCRRTQKASTTNIIAAATPPPARSRPSAEPAGRARMQSPRQLHSRRRRETRQAVPGGAALSARRAEPGAASGSAVLAAAGASAGWHRGSAAFPEWISTVRVGFTGSDAISVAFRSMVGGGRRRLRPGRSGRRRIALVIRHPAPPVRRDRRHALPYCDAAMAATCSRTGRSAPPRSGRGATAIRPRPASRSGAATSSDRQ